MNSYEEFINFIGAWFPDSDLEGVESDDQVVRNFLATEDKLEIELVRKQCEKLLKSESLPTEKIMDEANRFFDNEKACRKWLYDILEVLNEVK